MKVIFITASLSIVYVMRFGLPHRETYNKEDDAFPTQYILVPALLLGITVNQDHSSPFEMIWAFSIYLEAVAILPQLFMLQKQGGAESLTSHCMPPPARARRRARQPRLVEAGRSHAPASRPHPSHAPPRRLASQT